MANSTVIIKRVRAIVNGQVQGVYYRASTKTEATRLGLTGWVRNLANSDVEFEAEGPEDAIDALLRWAHQGPAMAQVNQIDVVSIQTSKENLSFEIRY